MKVVIAIDSFKGSLSTFESGRAVREAAETVFGNVVADICPLADGGEGTVDAVVSSLGGEIVKVDVTGPLGDRVLAKYGFVRQRRLAVIEMAEAAGLTLVPADKRDPKITTTYGVGELILHAIKENGCRSFLIGIGGSATSDGGVGMLQALGFEFLDGNDVAVGRGAAELGRIERVRIDGVAREIRECEFNIACDVENPLCGERGASYVYAPQKGADERDVALIDGCLSHYADITAKVFGKDMRDEKGAGAAGGMGFAFLSYLGGRLQSGIGLVIEATGLEERIKNADLVVTGEGRLDRQSAMGKAPVGVARVAKKHGKMCIAFSGCVTDGAEKCNDEGIDAYFPILQTPCTLEEAMDKTSAYKNLEKTATQVFRLINVTKNIVF